MAEVHTYFILSFIPILLSAFFLLYYLLKAAKVSHNLYSHFANIDYQSMEYQSNFYSHPLCIPNNKNHTPQQSINYDSSNQSPTQINDSCNSKKILSSKKYLSNCQNGLSFIRQANRVIMKNSHYLSICAVKKLRKHKKKLSKSQLSANFDPTQLQTIYQQAYY